MAIDWGSVIQTGVSALGNYFTAKQQASTQKSLAKIKAQAGAGVDPALLLAILANRTSPSQAPPVQPRVSFPQVAAPPTWAPLPLAGSLMRPVDTTFAVGQRGQTMAGQPPYVQPTMGNLDIPSVIGPILPQVPSLLQGLQSYTRGRGTPVIDGSRCPDLYQQGPAGGIRVRRSFSVINPVTGNQNWFRSVGRPILFSGDLATVKRVRRIAGVTRKAIPARATRSRKGGKR